MAHETDAVPPPEVVKAFALINGSAPEVLDELHDTLVATAATCHVWDPAGAVADVVTELEPDRRCGLSVEDCQKLLDELRRRDSGMRGRSTRNF